MSSPSPTPVVSRITIHAALVLLIAALYFAREVFIPIALSILLAFLLGPLVLRLQRAGLARVPSAVLTMGLVCGLTIGVALISTGQLVEFAGSLPSYRENIQTKLEVFRGGRGRHLAAFQASSRRDGGHCRESGSGKANRRGGVSQEV